MTSSDDSFRWPFEKLLEAADSGDKERFEELRQKILHQREETFEPLGEFVLEQPFHARLAPLLDLLGKMGDPRAARILMEFLPNPVEELRMQAAIGLGWLRARTAIEKLDELEGTDESDDVRQEARVAIEEILRDHPALKETLKYHEPLALPENPPSPTDPQVATPSEEMVALFPRLLSLKYRAVPLSLTSDDTLIFAVEETADPGFMTNSLQRLTNRQVQLRAWTKKRIGDHIVAFYQWGDDDWVQFETELSDAGWKELTGIIMDEIDPGSPPAALPDCADALECAQSFLAICAQEHITRARIEANPKEPRFEIVLSDKSGADHRLDSPPRKLRPRFLDVIQSLSRAQLSSSSRVPRSQGMIKHTINHEMTFIATVVYEEELPIRRLTLDFVDPEAN